jgi:drug/metabolite transporter (DMT)-like permease
MSRSYLYMTSATLFQAGAFIAGKIGGAEVSGLEMSFHRFTTVVVCLFIYGKIRGLSFRIERRKVLTIMLIMKKSGFYREPILRIQIPGRFLPHSSWPAA